MALLCFQWAMKTYNVRCIEVKVFKSVLHCSNHNWTILIPYRASASEHEEFIGHVSALHNPAEYHFIVWRTEQPVSRISSFPHSRKISFSWTAGTRRQGHLDKILLIPTTEIQNKWAFHCGLWPLQRITCIPPHFSGNPFFFPSTYLGLICFLGARIFYLMKKESLT